ncbi:MAG: hypothetical protein ACRDTM_13365 [Micromonosporaceae bacterium]
MDELSRTLLPAAAESGLSLTTLSRHTPVLRRNIADSDSVQVAARAVRADRPGHGEYVLMITQSRVVVTRETRLLRRIKPFLDAAVLSLVNVTWVPDPRGSAVDLAFTLGQTRHRFLINVPDRHQVWRFDAVFGQTFLQPLQLAF